MKIRVLHIFSPNAKKRFGGQTVLWKNIFNRWDADSITHLIIDFDQGDIVEARTFFDFEYPSEQQDISRIDRALWIIQLFKYLNKYKNHYDIVHVHIVWWAGLLIGLWAKLRNLPALYESVLLDSDTPTAIQKEYLGKIKILCLKSFKKILTISDYLADDYIRCGFGKEQIFSLMNPVDENTFFPVISNEEKDDLRKELSLPRDAKIIIFVGSVIARKGAHYLIEAFVSACQMYPDLYLLLIGPKTILESQNVDRNYLRGLYNILEQNNKSDRVNFLGLIQDKKLLSKYYRASDMFVFPSQKEGLGNVVLEAMASGLPVIVTELPVLKNVINHLENGLFVPLSSTSSSEIVSAISLLINNDLLKKKMGNNAILTIIRNHTYVKWQGDLVNFYNLLLVN